MLQLGGAVRRTTPSCPVARPTNRSVAPPAAKARKNWPPPGSPGTSRSMLAVSSANTPVSASIFTRSCVSGDGGLDMRAATRKLPSASTSSRNGSSAANRESLSITSAAGSAGFTIASWRAPVAGFDVPVIPAMRPRRSTTTRAIPGSPVRIVVIWRVSGFNRRSSDDPLRGSNRKTAVGGVVVGSTATSRTDPPVPGGRSRSVTTSNSSETGLTRYEGRPATQMSPFGARADAGIGLAGEAQQPLAGGVDVRPDRPQARRVVGPDHVRLGGSRRDDRDGQTRGQVRTSCRSGRSETAGRDMYRPAAVLRGT